MARYQSAADSAAHLDASFQRERSALNAEAAALGAADRRAADYARRYDAFTVRAQAAERVRAERDRARARARSYAERLPDIALRTEGAAAPTLEARDSVRPPAHRAPAARPATTLVLPAGTWWVGLAAVGRLPASTERVTIAGGRHDTLRLRPAVSSRSP